MIFSHKSSVVHIHGLKYFIGYLLTDIEYLYVSLLKYFYKSMSSIVITGKVMEMRGKPDVNKLILLGYYIRYTIWAMFICSHLGVLKNEFL